MKYWVIGYEYGNESWTYIQWDFEARDEALAFVEDYQSEHPKTVLGIIYGEWVKIEVKQ